MHDRKYTTEVGLWLFCQLNLHAFVDGRIQVLIETYSNIVTVVRSAYSKLRFDRNNDIQPVTLAFTLSWVDWFTVTFSLQKSKLSDLYLLTGLLLKLSEKSLRQPFMQSIWNWQYKSYCTCNPSSEHSYYGLSNIVAN